MKLQCEYSWIPWKYVQITQVANNILWLNKSGVLSNWRQSWICISELLNTCFLAPSHYENILQHVCFSKACLRPQSWSPGDLISNQPEWRRCEQLITGLRWLDSITELMDMNLGRLWEVVRDRETCSAAVHGVAKSWTQLGHWTTTEQWVKFAELLGSKQTFFTVMIKVDVLCVFDRPWVNLIEFTPSSGWTIYKLKWCPQTSVCEFLHQNVITLLIFLISSTVLRLLKFSTS